MNKNKLGIGIIGAGFVAKFHVKSFVGVRNADIKAIYSRTYSKAKSLAGLVENLGVGKPRVYSNIFDMLRDKEVDAIWVLVPNNVHLQYTKYIAEEASQGRNDIIGIAIEKPLARNVQEAKEMVKIVEKVGIFHGYLENQVFMPSIVRGREIIWKYGVKYSDRPYLARAAEEHAGPHNSWFWNPKVSGGGVLLDMMCHSIEAARFLLTDPVKNKDSIKPKSIYTETYTLKWLKEKYVNDLKKRFNIDFSKNPAEDYALTIIEYEDDEGNIILSETRTSWNFVGAGLRLSLEVLGPEYSLFINTLEPGSFLFFSRNIKAPPTEELVEKQNADQGLMPFIPDEAVTYGYINEDQHMVNSFLVGKMPFETWYDGLLVTQLMMLAYLSAEKNEKIKFNLVLVENYVPRIAREK